MISISAIQLYRKLPKHPTTTMLKHLAFAISNPKYDSLISLTQSTLAIHNQYVFLWSVLPKISGRFTRRIKFVRQMREYGFELINQKSEFNKQNSFQGEGQSQKILVFKAKCNEFMTSLKKIQEIKRRKMHEKEKLNQKIKSLQTKFHNIKESSSQNLIKQFELFDEVSSLSIINRNILMFNEEINQLFNSGFQLKKLSIGHATTFELLSHCLESENMAPLSKYKMKSLKNLSEFKNIK